MLTRWTQAISNGCTMGDEGTALLAALAYGVRVQILSVPSVHRAAPVTVLTYEAAPDSPNTWRATDTIRLIFLRPSDVSGAGHYLAVVTRDAGAPLTHVVHSRAAPGGALGAVPCTVAPVSCEASVGHHGYSTTPCRQIVYNCRQIGCARSAQRTPRMP